MWVTLPDRWVIGLNIIAWLFFHLAISVWMLKVPDTVYKQDSRWFQPFKWEKDGKVWDQWFKIRAWKHYLPDSSSILKDAYNKKHLKGLDASTQEKFIIETKRGEQTHWLSMLPAPLFFIWNPAWAGWVMGVYALLANLPFIITQRYNRPRLVRLYQRIRSVELDQQRQMRFYPKESS